MTVNRRQPTVDLHRRTRAEVERRRAVALAAIDVHGAPIWGTQITDLGWRACTPDEKRITVDYGAEETAVFVALHDPADAARRYERDLRTLERHDCEPNLRSAWCCRTCGPRFSGPGPCAELLDLAEVYLGEPVTDPEPSS